jgi:organic hydroperoxide reductase OsmC/OhrA
MPKSSHEHHFACHLTWIGSSRGPTQSYESYDRTYRIEIEGKPPLVGSSAPPYRGDGSLFNPEDWLVAALSACHCLSYLAIAARAELLVVSYEDRATGTMAMVDRRMRFREVTLRPRVHVAPGSDLDLARAFHKDAHEQCFIANSVNFPVTNEPEILIGD